MNSAHPASFGTLFARTIQVTKDLWKPIILGALLWLGLIVLVFLATIQGISLAGPVTKDPAKLLENGPSTADISVMVVTFLFVVFAVFIGWASTAYQQVLAVDRKPSVRQTLKRIPPLMLPLAYVSLWIFVRSYVWMPMIALLVALLILPRTDAFTVVLLAAGLLAMIACAVTLIPRLILAPVILIRENVRPLESVKLSEAYTKGRWGKIVGNWILLTLLLMLISFGMQSALGEFAETAGGYLMSEAPLALKIAMGIGAALFGVAYAVVYSLINFVPFAFIAELVDALKLTRKA